MQISKSYRGVICHAPILLSVVFFLLAISGSAQTPRYRRGNCLAAFESEGGKGLSGAVAGVRKKVPSARTDWSADKIYRIPVILVEFSDQKFLAENPQRFYDNLFNSSGFNLGHGPGCVSDYFRAQSGGMFNVQFDVVGPIALTTSCKNGGSYNYGTSQFISAIQMADSLLNFADYDWDGTSRVSQVVFVYAGYGANDNSSSVNGCIWPNTGSFRTQTLDGQRVSNYSASAERWHDDSYCGIGTICHELSHCFGLPDIYPVGGSEYSVLDEWDLMDGGNYSDRGWCPPNYTAHEKELLGWLAPLELQTTQTICDMKPLEQGGEAYRITNDGDAREYYLLENRQQRGWDSYLPGHGLTVLHVDFDSNIWEGNYVNTEKNHHRLDFIHASGNSYTYYESLYGHSNYKDGRNMNLCGSAFPLLSDTLVVTDLTDTSVPSAATLFNQNAQGTKFMGKPIMNIQESADGLITFQFYENVEAGVRSVPQNNDSAGHIYNLYGQRLQEVPRRGLSISNGRKIVTR